LIAGHISGVEGLFYDFTTMMVLVNSCINPFIYAAKYREFQTGVKRLLRKPVEPSVLPADLQMGRISGRVTGPSPNAAHQQHIAYVTD